MRTVKQSQRGIGLIELMISMALGLFLISGAISVFITSKQSYSLNSEMSWIQDNVRFASATLNKDLRMAGFFGCGASDSLVSTLDVPGGSGWYVDFDKAVSGWDGDNAAYPTPEFPAAYNSNSSPGIPNSDLLSIRRADDTKIRVSSHEVNSAVIHIVDTHPFIKGDILLATDCRQAAVFQAAGYASNHVTHNTGASTSPGNCTKKLGPHRCVTGGTNDYEYKQSEGAFIMRVAAHAYYIAEAEDGTPAMYRREIKTESENIVTADEELIQGIENIQVFYGLDTNADGFANRYIDAEDVASTDWGNVVSLRVHLLFRSLLPVTTEPQEFRFVGNTYTPADRFLRQEIVSTIKIRNKG